MRETWTEVETTAIKEWVSLNGPATGAVYLILHRFDQKAGERQLKKPSCLGQRQWPVVSLGPRRIVAGPPLSVPL